MAAKHDEEQPPAQPGPLTWKDNLLVVFVLLTIPLMVVLWVDFAVRAARWMQEEPVRYSVELVGAKGIGLLSLDPGAESPAFNLLLHVDNGHTYDEQMDAGTEIVVSYAGVPLARGSAPAWCVEPKKAVAVAVDATSGGGVGIPDDLFKLMAEERRSGVAHQLDVDLRFDYGGLFTCRVEMVGVHRASECQQLNRIWSS